MNFSTKSNSHPLSVCHEEQKQIHVNTPPSLYSLPYLIQYTLSTHSIVFLSIKQTRISRFLIVIQSTYFCQHFFPVLSHSTMFSQHLDKKCFQTASIVLFCLISSTSSLIVKHKKLTKLHVDKTLDINSLDLPQNLSGYHLSAPHNHKITVNCSYVSADNASSGEYLLVQTDVTHNGDGGQSIFVSSNFTKTSLFNHLIIVLRQNGTSTSSELSDDAARGHFACHVQVETAKRCNCGWGRQVFCIKNDFFFF